MPKVPKNEEKPHKQKPYVRVTSQSTDRFDLFHPEDKTNITYTSRDTDEYSDMLGMPISLEKTILDTSKKLGRKIKILDAGCGQSVTIDSLLSNKKLDEAIESISGVSLHYFTHTKQVMDKHRKRFNYYNGQIQDVLAKAHETHGAFDIIVDVYGAYAYSKDKLELLKQYHQALQPFGKAYVYANAPKDITVQMGKTRSKQFAFSKWASKIYPETFFCQHIKKTYKHSKYSPIILTKATQRFPLQKYDIQEYKSIVTAGASFFSMEELKKGNAVRPASLVVTPAEESKELRPLSF